MTNQRDAELHEDGASINAEIEMIPLMGFGGGPVARFVYGSNDFDAPGIPPSSIARKMYSFEIGGQMFPVIETCKHYLQLIDKLVGDFDQRIAGHP